MIWQRTMATQMAEARFNQVGVDIEAVASTATVRVRAARHRADARVRRVHPRLQRGARRRARRGRRVDAARAHGRAAPAHARGPARAALHAAAAALLGGVAREDARGARASAARRPTPRSSRRSRTAGTCASRTSGSSPRTSAEVVTDKLIEHFPDVVDVNFTAHMEEELDDIAEGRSARIQVLARVQRAVRAGAREGGALVRALQSRSSTRTCPLCPTEGREPGQLEVKLGRFGKFVGCAELPASCKYIRNMDGSESPRARDARRDLPRVRPAAAAARRAVRARSSAAAATRTASTSRRTRRRTLGITCPQCKEGEIVEKRTRFGAVLRVRPLPGLRLRREQRADQGSPVPRVRLAPGPAAEVDPLLELRRGVRPGVQRSRRTGDAEAEAEARAAKAAARAARAAAKKKKSPAKKTAAKKTTARKTDRRRRPPRSGSPPAPDRARRPRPPGEG